MTVCPEDASTGYTDLSLAHRPELFGQIRATDPTPPYQRCAFAGRPGWVVSHLPPARVLLTSSAGRKSRPARSQHLLGGVGALPGDRVRSVKHELVDAMRTEATRPDRLRAHLRAVLPELAPRPEALTEALSGATLAQLTGRSPGSVDGARLRELVLMSWAGLEVADRGADGRIDDELCRYIRRLVTGSDSGFLSRLRGGGWSGGRIAEELRAMVLAGWGSTTAAVLSALALGAGTPALGVSQPVISEVLRLYPPSFMIARTVVEPPPAPLPFAVGNLVLISPWLIHRNPSGWSDPERFDPARWHSRIPARWFLPFGLGPRRCPAAAFARAQIAVALDLCASAGPTPASAALSMVESRSPALIPRWTA